jgi:hypothetical protein
LSWNIFPSFHFQAVIVFASEAHFTCLAGRIQFSLIFLNVAYHSVSVNWIVEIINTHGYCCKVCSNSCHCAVFVMPDSFSILICLSILLWDLFFSMVHFSFHYMCRIPLNVFGSAALVVINSFTLCLLWKDFIFWFWRITLLDKVI